MAGSNSSRLWRPKKGRRGGNLPRTHPDKRASGYVRKSPEKTANGSRGAQGDARVTSFHSNRKSAEKGLVGSDAQRVAPDLLKNVARRLDIAVRSALVCRLALDGQNVECDQDIATVLKWSVADELQRQIERIDQISRVQSKTDRTKQGRRQKAGGLRKPPKALRAPRSVLNDVRYRLSLVVGTTTVCRAALETQHAERDVDIAAMLKHVVIDNIRAQIERIRGVTTGTAKKRQRNARVVP
jgi:hypothetical protein